jgi:hypothetical protein
MKTTPSGTIKVVALAGLGVAIVITFRALAQTPTPTPTSDDINNFVLQIKKNPGEYHPLKTNGIGPEATFIALVCDKQNHHFDSTKEMRFKSKKIPGEFKLPKDCDTARSALPSGAQLNIKTNKVTVSETAKRIEAGEVTPIGDPNVTIKIASHSPEDIKAVLDQLSPSP